MNAPVWSQLIVDLDEVDVGEALAPWRWLLDRPVSPLCMSRFGDWFLTDAKGSVLHLDILEGTLAPLCSTTDAFHSLRQRDQQLLEWFQDGMVYACYSSGTVPARGQCLSYLVPPLIGGSFDRSNITCAPVSSWQAFMSALHRQALSLPPGARVIRLETDPVTLVRIVYEVDGGV